MAGTSRRVLLRGGSERGAQHDYRRIVPDFRVTDENKLKVGKVDAAGHGRDRRKGEASAGARKAHDASLGSPPR